jgi:hypothetical protein
MTKQRTSPDSISGDKKLLKCNHLIRVKVFKQILKNKVCALAVVDFLKRNLFVLLFQKIKNRPF